MRKYKSIPFDCPKCSRHTFADRVQIAVGVTEYRCGFCGGKLAAEYPSSVGPIVIVIGTAAEMREAIANRAVKVVA